MKNILNKKTLIGLLIGISSPLIFLPVIWAYLGFMNNTSFGYEYLQFKEFDYSRSSHISLALISNLIWFYIFINKEKYNVVRGIVFAMFFYAPYIVYVYFFTDSLSFG